MSAPSKNPDNPQFFVVFLMIVGIITGHESLFSPSNTVEAAEPQSRTESNCTISPTDKLCAAFVIVHVGEPFVVAIVADVNVVFNGVIS